MWRPASYLAAGLVLLTCHVLASATDAAGSGTAFGQAASEAAGGSVHVRLNMAAQSLHANHAAHVAHLPPAVVWLTPVHGSVVANSPGPQRTRYTLLQKHKMFLPHLLVVPVGSVVTFPNADPFFHNVFSLFDGRRFDLGLYEAGSTKEVLFSREGVSYIFCNIHPEMSAVVLALSTPLYTVAESAGEVHLDHVAPGDYDLHVWVEGEPQTVLDGLTRRIHVGDSLTDLGTITLQPGIREKSHTNLYGRPYDAHKSDTY